MRIRLNFNNIRLYLDVLIILILSGTAYKVVYPLESLIYLLLIFHIKELILLPRRIGVGYSIIAIMIVFTFFSHAGVSWMWYVQLLLQITAIYCVTLKYSSTDISKVFLNIMTFIAVESLILYPLVHYTGFGANIPIVISSHGARYSMLPGFVFSVGASGRNCGIFWEPGIFASMLTICLVLNLYRFHTEGMVNRKKKRKKFYVTTAIFIVAIFTTSSSAGIILVGLFFILSYVIELDLRSMSTSKIMILILGVSITIFVIFNFTHIISWLGLENNKYWSRLLSLEEISNNPRIEYFIRNLLVIKDRILLGYGIKETNIIARGGADTCTSMYMITLFGIMGASYSLLFIDGILKLQLNIISKILIGIMLFFILNKEPHLYNMNSWLLLFSILQEGKSKNMKFGTIRTR